MDRGECHPEAERVGGHVPRVRQQRQRARGHTGHDLDHEERQDQEERGAQRSFVPRARAPGFGRDRGRDPSLRKRYRETGRGLLPLLFVLQARELSVEVGGRLVVEGASLTVRARDKVGLVGRNGAGKTSLLRVLGGAAPAAAGVVHRQGALGYLPQDPRIAGLLDGVTALDRTCCPVVGSTRRRCASRSFASRWRRTTATRTSLASPAPKRRFALDGGYAAESEVRSLVAGLGIDGDRVDLPLSVLSGGERRRVELARILFAGSDVLLLDEPTNHLDVDARAWLMKFLRTYRGALLVISHDLDLLDEAITRVLHLDRPNEELPGHMVEYKGTYSQYLAARAKDEIRLTKIASQQDAEIKRLTTLADKIRAKATLASKAHNLDKRADRIRAAHVEAPTHDRTLKVKLPPPPHTGRVLLEVDGVTKSYDGPPVFSDVSFALERGERLLVLGLNGAGKTSLLRILAGEALADRGTVEFGLGVSLGYYAQEHEGIQSPAAPCSTTCVTTRSPPTSSCAACSGCSVSAVTRRSRTRARCRAARRRSSPSRSSSPAATTCCCSTSPRTTSTRARAPRSRPHSRRGRAAW